MYPHNNNSSHTPKAATRVVKINETGVLLVSPLLASQITALHKKAGSIEWSGVLLYRVINDDLESPKNFRAVAEAVFPMDFGSSGYTEYDYDENALEIFEVYPKADPENNRNPWKLGHIHTHHGMGAFFSGTDDGELKDNADKYPYYVSLVVDFKGTYVAKVAFMAKTERFTSYQFRKKWKKIKHTPEEVLVTADLEVKIMVDDWFHQKLGELGRSRPIHHVQHSTGVTHTTPYTYPHNRPNLPAATQPVVANNLTLWGKVREKSTYLFLEDKVEAQKAVLFFVWAEVLKELKTEQDMKRWVGDCMDRVEDWLAEHFKEETGGTDIFAEEKILNTLISLLKTQERQNILVPKVISALDEYVKINYNMPTSKPEKVHTTQRTMTEEDYLTMMHGGDD